MQLPSSGIGCYIGLNFRGALAYADDIVLISPTASATRKMLSVCESFAARFDIQFNVQKPKCMMVSVRKEVCAELRYLMSVNSILMVSHLSLLKAIHI